MIHDEAVAVIDFQDALLAPPQYDLASLLNDRITDSVIQPDLEEKLVDYYIDKKSRYGKANASTETNLPRCTCSPPFRET